MSFDAFDCFSILSFYVIFFLLFFLLLFYYFRYLLCRFDFIFRLRLFLISARQSGASRAWRMIRLMMRRSLPR